MLQYYYHKYTKAYKKKKKKEKEGFDGVSKNVRFLLKTISYYV